MPFSSNGAGIRFGALATTAVVALSFLAGPAAAAADPVYTDVLYMIDVSGSVIGLGQSQGDILPQLIQALVDEIYLTIPGTTIIIATFSDGILDVDGPGDRYQGIWSRTVDDSTREEIVSYIRGLDAAVRQPQGHGQVTALYDSARETLSYLDQLRENWNSEHPDMPYESTHLQKIIVFTDGMDNASKVWTESDFLREFERLSAEGPMRDRLFIKIVTAPGVDPGLEGIPVETGYGTRTVELIGLPAVIDLGNLSSLKNGESVTRVLDLWAQRPVPTARIQYTWQFAGIPTDALSLTLNPTAIDGHPTQLRLTLIARILDREALSQSLLAEEGTTCTGRLNLSTNNPRVTFLPSETALRFSYEPTGVVTLSPAQGQTTAFPDLARPAGEPQSVGVSYLLEFDDDAAASGLKVQAGFRWAGDNPADIEALSQRLASAPPLVAFTWSPGGPMAPVPGPVTLDATVQRLKVVLTLQPELDKELPGGTYAGYLVLSLPPTAIAKFDERQSSPEGTLEVPMTARVARLPLPWWVWLLLALGLATLGLFLYQRTRPRFTPNHRLEVTYPDGARDSVDLYLYGRASPWKPTWVTLGDAYSDVPLRVTQPLGVVSAARGPRLDFEPNPETVKTAAEDGVSFTINDEPVSDRTYRLQDGDEIRFGDTRIVCSLALDAGVEDSLDLEF